MSKNSHTFDNLSPADLQILLEPFNVTTHVEETKALSVNEIAYKNGFVLIYPHQLDVPARVALAKLVQSLPQKLVIFGGPQNPPPHN